MKGLVYICNAAFAIGMCLNGAFAASSSDPLNYTNIDAVYTAPVPENVTTLYDFISSRSELSSLKSAIDEIGGFRQAFDTSATWDFTFFAPNNDAFENNVGRYFNTFAETPKGKWWLGNTLVHHYVPSSIITSSDFNETTKRFQTATYLFVSAQRKNNNLVLNGVANVVESDIDISNGKVHIIDKILDPSAQVFEPDYEWIDQGFIAGSCSNPDLAYC